MNYIIHYTTKYCAPDWEKFTSINSDEYLLLSWKLVKKESRNQELDQVWLVRLSDSLYHLINNEKKREVLREIRHHQFNEYLSLSVKLVKKESRNQEVDQVLLVRLSDSLYHLVNNEKRRWWASYGRTDGRLVFILDGVNKMMTHRDVLGDSFTTASYSTTH